MAIPYPHIVRSGFAALKAPIVNMGKAYLFFWASLAIKLGRPLIIGITGSVGKTTTTQMIGRVLMHEEARPLVGRVRTTSASANMNDDVGLPLTVLGYQSWVPARRWPLELVRIPFKAVQAAFRGPNVLVLEYGTHAKGHLDVLARIAPPTVAVVTAVGPAHLERWLTVEGVASEKSEILKPVPPSGLIVMGDENAHIESMTRGAKAPVKIVSGRGVGLAAAIAREVAAFFKVPSGVVERALSEFEPVESRLNYMTAGTVAVINDAVNANPMSMRLALEFLAESAKPGQRRVAVLGYMAELGAEAEAYHIEIGRLARSKCDLIIGVGDLAKNYAPDHWFEDAPRCRDALKQLLSVGDLVLFKGSGVVGLGSIVKSFKAASEVLPPLEMISADNRLADLAEKQRRLGS